MLVEILGCLLLLTTGGAFYYKNEYDYSQERFFDLCESVEKVLVENDALTKGTRFSQFPVAGLLRSIEDMRLEVQRLIKMPQYIPDKDHERKTFEARYLGKRK